MKWRSAVQLGRVSNLPTVWSNVLAGLALSGAPVRPLFLAGLAVALSCFYVGGMFLNDGFDREVDARERPERPLPSGRATPREVFAIGFGLLAAGLVLLTTMAWLGPGPHAVRPTVAAGLALGALIVAYDLHHKKNPLGPLVMALCRGTVYVTLARMQEKGYVESRLEPLPAGAIGLPRRLYRPTAYALRVLDAWSLAARAFAAPPQEA